MKVCPTCQNEYPDEVDFCPTDGTKLRAPRTEGTDPLIGRALDGRWIIEEKLGEGGMGAVYRGHQRSVNRTVAIKTLRPQLVDSEEFVDRFFREAQIAGNISHPHCVTILDYGESDDGTLFLAMEFLDGESLTDRLEQGSLGIKHVIKVGIQVASALSAAHEQQIVHRDLKPDNIFLIDVPGGATFAKVLDFGIAKMLDSNTQMTKTGMIFGTPEYMSPEQCRGGEIDGRSDLYSLGCILYELVGGRTPFRATTPMAVLMAHVNQSAPALSEGDTAAHVPPGLEQIIMKLLEKDPDRRFQSATEVRQALEGELQRLDSHDGTAPHPAPEMQTRGPREVVAPPVEMGFDETVGMQSTDQQERVAAADIDTVEGEYSAGASYGSNRGKIVVAAVVGMLAIAVLGGVSWMMLAGGEEEETSEPTVVVEEGPTDPADEPTEPTEAVAVEDPTPTPPAEAAVDEADETDETEDEAATDEPSEPAVAAKTEPERKPKRQKPKQRTRTKPKTTEPTATVDDKPAKDSEPKPRKRKKPKDVLRDVDKTVERESKRAKDEVEGAERKLDNIMEGLMGE